jgi:hypothetical protein
MCGTQRAELRADAYADLLSLIEAMRQAGWVLTQQFSISPDPHHQEWKLVWVRQGG